MSLPPYNLSLYNRQKQTLSSKKKLSEYCFKYSLFRLREQIDLKLLGMGEGVGGGEQGGVGVSHELR
jgi:hypothetical protein